MIYLTRFPDNTFYWTDGKDNSEILKKSESIAHGYWNYGIKKTEIKLSMDIMITFNKDVAMFDTKSKLIVDFN